MTFRVWAPHASSVAVRLGGEVRELDAVGDGVFEVEARAGAGEDYLVVLDGGRQLPDPCSRCQPEGLLGPSRIVELPEWKAWAGLDPDDLVLYELHVGAFSDEGTFDGAIPYLRGLRELGMTAVELMPVATFPGNRGWGYDGVYAYAPHPAYGGPEGLARFVQAAHDEGLGVVLDVVYNHIGPGSERIAAFGPYFTDRHETFWGDGMNFAERGVREWAIGNACMWIRDYGIDGLRLDATHAIFDDSDPHVLRELRDRVKEIDPRALVIAETSVGDERPARDWGHDAQWADALHHALHVLLTGETDGYYSRYGRVRQVAQALEAVPAERYVVCAQNHDQVGNRAVGDRLPPELLRVASSVALLAPQTPLLFMGEEYGEPNPFQFFTDHIDPAIAEATREGRKREFAAFSGFGRAEVPDPQDPATFERSKLSRCEQGGLREHYRRLLALRRTLPRAVETQVDEERRTLRVRRGHAELVVDFARRAAELRA